MIVFDEPTHTYTNKDTQERYISVTTLLGKYKLYFDKEAHSLRVAEREGLSQEYVLDMWRQITERATTRGSSIHKVMENYVLDNTKREDCFEKLYNSYDYIVRTQIGNYDSVFSEKLLWSHDYKVAGTADLLFHQKDGFIVGDFKTNKRFRYDSAFNKWLKGPVDHLPECEYSTYSLQLSLYGMMYEKMTGLKCKGCIIFYDIKGEWVPIRTLYLKSECKDLLLDYKVKVMTGELNIQDEKRDYLEEVGILL
jgi:ATP-dependent exoDNAse (exonuclease V) beta subunit